MVRTVPGQPGGSPAGRSKGPVRRGPKTGRYPVSGSGPGRQPAGPGPAGRYTARERAAALIRRRHLAPYVLLLPSVVVIGALVLWPASQIGLFSFQNYGLPQVTGARAPTGRRGGEGVSQDTTVRAADPSLTRLADAILVPPFPGASAPRWILDALGSGLAGVTLFGQNISAPSQVRALTAGLRAACADADPVIAIDEEGGDVTRVGPGRAGEHTCFRAIRTAATRALLAKGAATLSDTG